MELVLEFFRGEKSDLKSHWLYMTGIWSHQSFWQILTGLMCEEMKSLRGAGGLGMRAEGKRAACSDSGYKGRVRLTLVSWAHLVQGSTGWREKMPSLVCLQCKGSTDTHWEHYLQNDERLSFLLQITFSLPQQTVNLRFPEYWEKKILGTVI